MTTIHRQLLQILLLVSTLLVLVSCQLGGNGTLPANASGTFNWTALNPSTSLQWVPCFEGKECARFQRPMDPSDPSLNETVALAVIRSPAAVPRTDPNYGGSIFMNPGGPGSSGVGILRWASYEMQEKIAGPKYFDLVSWDPRGIGASTPIPQCFSTDLERQAFWLKQDAIGGIASSPFAIQWNFAAAEAFGQSCNSTVMRYMTTLLSVQDVVAMADALEPNVTKPLINFWGISYGTFMANTLASVYPERIGKFVLDGTLSTEDYLSSALYRGLVNTSAIYDYFYQTCYQAGPNKCAIWDNSTGAIRAKVDNLVNRLGNYPIAVYNQTGHGTDVLNVETIQALLFQDMYFPPIRFPSLAQTLAGLMQNPPNTTLAAAGIMALRNPDTPLPTEIIKPSNNSWSNPLVPSPLYNSDDSAIIISCTDGNPINNWTTADIQNYISEIDSLFPLASYTWPHVYTFCTRWPNSKRAPENVRFTGPFGSNLSSYSTDRGARPLMFIGNRADAVCSLLNAEIESAKHEGSVILQTDIYGHSSQVFNSNECAWSYYRQFFNTGELPAEGTVCPRDPWAWDPNPQPIPGTP